ncbi:Microcystinase C [Alteripontixanthobacter maritimus]|uniref:Microcystinase C n=1 Tax=Alteripontixanthobacter maritimus TaxID=2161824 RepID=A0A369Q8Q6_9SPHN|nr:M81 family metallopeptidase [Alteripontixanthobacter maritimus]RDC60862.1 Microcystinase C [Alteripontixanthobacter maritimus]
MTNRAVFIAGLMTETNTFSPIKTDLGAFEEQGLYYGDGTRRAPDALHLLAMSHWRALADDKAWTTVESLAAFAQPAGPTNRDCYEAFRAAILDDLQRAGEVDLVLLNLHGAMVAEGLDDCEGDLLQAIREITGPDVAVGALLDLHAHLTPAMVRSADLIISYKHYPHDDIVERAAELFRLTSDVASHRISPAAAVADCRLIGLWPTTGPAMASIVNELTELEKRPDILTASLVHGFPWGDVEDAGARALVYANGNPGSAKAAALYIARRFHSQREAVSSRYHSIEQALDEAAKVAEGPIVLADMADNAGGGAPSDSTFLLQAMLERGMSNAIIGCYFDPQSVERCFAAGNGASARLELGGKHGIASGPSLPVKVRVIALEQDHWQTGLGGSRVHLGRTALVDAGGIFIAICSVRAQVFAPDAFVGLGVDVETMHVVAVKSTQHFHSRFAPIARRVIYVATPGAISPQYDRLPFTKRDSDVWPINADPPPPHLLDLKAT